jgi:hypothetical protein
VGLALTIALAGPAAASSTDPSTSPALKAWLATPTISASAVTSASPSGAQPDSIKVTDPTGGKRITETRGGALLWTQNIIQWFWTSSAITSSTSWQGDGYSFPNTAKLDGIKRTYKSSIQEDWRGTETIGAGVVTPWGNVDVYESTINDYFVINRGGTYTYST